MAHASLAPVLRYIRKLASAPPGTSLSDAQLLQLWVRQHDEEAFTELVRRHGPLVWRACRQVLHHEHDTEDAFQASFLILARHAGSIRKSEAVAGWLYRVAYRTASNVGVVMAKRRALEKKAGSRQPMEPPSEAAWQEMQALLHEEVNRLPEKYRVPFVLCCLEGKSGEDAARQLGWKAGTVRGRLTQARKLLQRRLARRGVELSIVLCGLTLSSNTSMAAVPAGLAASTVRAALLLVARSPGAPGLAAGLVSSEVACLVEGASKAMAATKLTLFTGLLLVGGLVAAVGGVLAQRERAPQPASPGRSDSTKSTDKAGDRVELPAGIKSRTDRNGDPLPPGALLRFGSARLRHGGGIDASALSPDRKLLATTASNSVVVWELATGKRVHVYPCDHSRFASPGITFSPDGKRLGYVRGAGFACVWDLQTDKELIRIEGLRDRGTTLCHFTPDSKQFVLMSREHVSFCDLESRKEVRSFPARSVSLLSPDAGTYVAIEENRTIVLGETRTGKETDKWAVPAAHNGVEIGVAFSPDGRSLGVVEIDKEVQVRDLASGHIRISFPLPDIAKRNREGRAHPEYRIGFTADGRTLLLGTLDGVIHRWDLATKQELPPLAKHLGAVTGFHSLADGQTLLSTGADGFIRRWNLKTGRQDLEPESYLGRSKAAYSQNGRFVAIGDARGRIDLWDGQSGKLVRTIQQDGAGVDYLAFAPDCKLLAAAERSGTVRLWQVPSGRPGAVWQQEPTRNVWCCNGLHFSPDGRVLCISDYPKRIRVAEVSSGKLHWTGECSYGEAFSPDGATLFVAAPAGSYLTMLEATTGKKRATVRLNSRIPDNLGVMYILASSPDGRRLAVAQGGRKLILCDGHTGVERQRLADHDLRDELRKVELGGKMTNRIEALAFSPDSKWFAAAGTDTVVYIWETATGKEVLRLPGHEAEVSSLAFSPGGRTLFSYGQDGQGYLWNLMPKPAAGPKDTAESLWTDLAAPDAVKAYRAVWALSADAKAASALLRQKIILIKPVGKDHVAKLIADLDSNRFQERQAATKALSELGDLAAPALKDALKTNPSLEARQRLRALLDVLEKEPTPHDLRLVRAVQALELAGTAEARQVLRDWARGAAEARLTQDAKASLERLAKQPTVHPP